MRNTPLSGGDGRCEVTLSGAFVGDEKVTVDGCRDQDR